jgi:hypothetical protein
MARGFSGIDLVGVACFVSGVDLCFSGAWGWSLGLFLVLSLGRFSESRVL